MRIGDRDQQWYRSHIVGTTETKQEAIDKAKAFVDYLYLCKAMARVAGKELRLSELPPFNAPTFVASVPALKLK